MDGGWMGGMAWHGSYNTLSHSFLTCRACRSVRLPYRANAWSFLNVHGSCPRCLGGAIENRLRFTRLDFDFVLLEACIIIVVWLLGLNNYHFWLCQMYPPLSSPRSALLCLSRWSHQALHTSCMYMYRVLHVTLRTAAIVANMYMMSAYDDDDDYAGSTATIITDHLPFFMHFFRFFFSTLPFSFCRLLLPYSTGHDFYVKTIVATMVVLT